MTEHVESANSLESLVSDVADEFLERLDRGEQPDIEQYAHQHPQIAAVLRQILPALQVIRAPARDSAKPGDKSPAEAEALGRLGDYRIVREIGRGGMGVVYEAEQISLHRRVALKVLPFAAALDSRQSQRFQNEARAAAHLHHTNIVPVFAVGCERGVHYYAMQLIDGRTLADLIGELRHKSGHVERDSADVNATGLYTPGCAGEQSPALNDTADSLAAAVSTQHATHDPAFLRTLVRLGVQAAEALEHAHQLGVVHRDIKPANLLVDLRGNLWITDFGLAQLQTDNKLTLTGDLLGTLRYMSPEQALAQRVGVDQRTDIYSLGATLYELLTLEPVFDGQDRQALLRQIAFDEPRLPRRLNKAIPSELETIVLKALAKNPGERYGTAQELADDLERFLKDEPIRAKRPTLLRRAQKWGRRHQAVVVTAAVGFVVALAILIAGTGWIIRDHEARHQELARKAERDLALTEQGVLQAVEQATKFRGDLLAVLTKPNGVQELLNQPGRWVFLIQSAQSELAQARRSAARAEGSLGAELTQALDNLTEQLSSDELDRLLALRLEKIRLDRASWVEGRFDYRQAAAEYPLAFAEFAILKEDAATVAARLRSSPIKEQLVAALDDWAVVAFLLRDQPLVEQLLAVARQAAPDPDWADRLRQIEGWRDQEVLGKLVAEAPSGRLSPQTLGLVGGLLPEKSSLQESWLRSAQAQYPADFWLNFNLAKALQVTHPMEAAGFYRVALAVRPASSAAYNNLGYALWYEKKLPEAVAAYLKAIEIDPKHLFAYTNLGNALREQKKLPEAIAACHKAIEIDPSYAPAYFNLGIALNYEKKLSESIAAFQKCIDLDPKNAIAYRFLGFTLRTQEKVSESIAAFQKAIDLDPKYVLAYFDLGTTLEQQGQFTEALAALRRGEELGSYGPGWNMFAGHVVKCERLLKLDDRLPAVLRDGPALSQKENAEFGQLCSFKRRHAAAASFFDKAYAQQQGGTHLPGIQAAVLAGCAQGDDAATLDDKGRARWRQQALDWLKADLAVWTKQLASQNSKSRDQAEKALQDWCRDPDLDRLRDGMALDRLPAEEHEAWSQLWADVAGVLTNAP